MVSAFVPRFSSPGSTLAGVTVLCSWVRHLTLTVPLSPRCINGYWQIVGETVTNCGRVTCDGLTSHSGE